VPLLSAAAILLEFRSEFAAAPERVFSALTDASQLVRWFCDDAESDAARGGRLTMRWTKPGASQQAFEGRWAVFRPSRSCAYEGGHSGYPDGYAGRVGFELSAGSAGTVLITRHRLPLLPEYEPIAETYRGAWPRALARLAAYLAAGDGAAAGTGAAASPPAA
jgi:uncharacterized protein YndB with AHSA1/START domain